MSRRSDSLLENLVQLQVRLRACRERLRAGTDSEGLHDLRIALRRLRSLLRPLRQQLPGALELRCGQPGNRANPRHRKGATVAPHGIS